MNIPKSARDKLTPKAGIRLAQVASTMAEVPPILGYHPVAAKEAVIDTSHRNEMMVIWSWNVKSQTSRMNKVKEKLRKQNFRIIRADTEKSCFVVGPDLEALLIVSGILDGKETKRSTMKVRMVLVLDP
ncbi:MAG: hypothetical protein QM705_08775 [Ancrocorticia sp.]